MDNRIFTMGNIKEITRRKKRDKKDDYIYINVYKLGAL